MRSKDVTPSPSKSINKTLLNEPSYLEITKELPEKEEDGELASGAKVEKKLLD